MPNRRNFVPTCITTCAVFVAVGILACNLRAQIAPEPRTAPSTDPVAESTADTDTYARVVRPLLDEFCFDCHNSDTREGDLALSELNPEMKFASDAERWHEALNRINLGEMPPEDELQPSDQQRREIVRWLTDSLDIARQSSKTQPKNSIRRLTKQQYSNTLADLLSLPIDFGKNLPDDPKSEMGFTNSAETLTVSSLEAEYYQAIAREALDIAVVPGERPEPKRYRATLGTNVGQGHHAAAIGGYQSGPIPSKHVRVEILDEDGQPKEGETKEEKAKLLNIERNIGIGMRGSSSDRYRITDNGLVLFSALPHQERVPKSWQGPSPNMKMLVRRCYPRGGPFVTRVVASLASVKDYTFLDGLTALRSIEPMVQLPGDSQEDSIVAPGATVLRADETLYSDQLVAQGKALVPRDITKPSMAAFEFNLPVAGYYQVDLVHPATVDDAMPSVSVWLDDSDQHLRLEASEAPRDQMVVTALAHAHINEGKHSLRLGGKFFVGIREVVLTPLPPDHEASKQLADELKTTQASRPQGVDASLRAFIGTRTDDGMEYGEYDQPQVVSAAPGEWQTLEFHGRLENLPVPIFDETERSDLSNIMLVGIWNDHLVKDHSQCGVPVVIRSIEIEAPHYEVWPPQSHTDIFFEDPNQQSDRDTYTKAVLSRFMQRAFRREIATEEVDRYFAFWKSIRDEYPDYHEGVKETLVAILCSPHFLYIANPAALPDAVHEKSEQPPAEFALAERLSYFLWNSPPDTKLAQLAAQNRLTAELPAEVNRMLGDERVDRFVRSFCNQWLRLDRQQAMSVNVRKYPDYTRFVKRDMRLETYEFFRHTLREDLSLLTLIDSDFAMLNQNLAEFYGVPGVLGNQLRPVPISPDLNRGGLLSQGAFLTGHSDGTHSHPIKRAVWVKEKILGSPPPPPPPNVPELDPETPGFEKLTLKQQLELHRDKASCQDCHRKIDPYGVVFENYDAVGRYRTKAKGQPVDAKTELPDGTAINGVAELKSHILKHKRDDFTRSLVSHLLAYGLGRDLSFTDQPAIDQIVKRVRDQDYAMQSVIMEVVRSTTFSGVRAPETTQIGQLSNEQ